MKFYAMKAVDLLIIGALLFGSASVSTFALILIASMIVLTGFGVFLINEAMALKLREQSKFRAAIRWGTCFAYVIALLYTDHPVWAASYAIVTSVFMAGVFHKLKGAA